MQSEYCTLNEPVPRPAIEYAPEPSDCVPGPFSMFTQIPDSGLPLASETMPEIEPPEIEPPGVGGMGPPPLGAAIAGAPPSPMNAIATATPHTTRQKPARRCVCTALCLD